MNKSSKLLFATAILAVFGVANAQEANAPIETTAPAAEATALVEAAQASIEESAPQVNKVVKPKAKKKIGFAMVDFPANFEIQGKKVMPIDSDASDDNLDLWWGRANLMVETQSESFKGKVHLRMYPGEFSEKIVSKERVEENGESKLKETLQPRDKFEIYEAWAWHKGDYFNFKIGRWSNTTRFGSQTFGGYVDAKKDNNLDDAKTDDGLTKNVVRREAGFMSVYNPENSVQFGFHNASENISLDLSLISMDKNLNKGDLRVYLRFEDLANVEGLNLGIGYRSNLFDEIYSKYGDVTHTIAFGGSVPILTDVSFFKNINLFVETAIIGLDDQNGINCPETYAFDISRRCPSDKGKLNDFERPILAGLEIDLYRSFNKIVIEAEHQKHRKNKEGTKEHVKDILGSIYVQKQLNDRFTINLGMQSDNTKDFNTKDFSFAGRLQGRIN